MKKHWQKYFRSTSYLRIEENKNPFKCNRKHITLPFLYLCSFYSTNCHRLQMSLTKKSGEGTTLHTHRERKDPHVISPQNVAMHASRSLSTQLLTDHQHAFLLPSFSYMIAGVHRICIQYVRRLTENADRRINTGRWWTRPAATAARQAATADSQLCG